MYPEIYRFEFNGNEIIVHGYGLMIALGVLAAYSILILRRRYIGISVFQINILTTLIILSAYLGGRLVFLITYELEVTLAALFNNDGFIFYGAFVPGILTLIFWSFFIKISTLKFLDEISIVIPIIHGFGRLGCFLAGCCYGLECRSAIGVNFTDPQSQAIPLNQPLYPTQLLEVLLNVLIIIVLLFGRRYKKFQFNGQQFLVYLILYAIGRFNIDFLRGDYINNSTLHQSQVIAIFLLILGVICYSIWSRKNKSPSIQ